MWCCRRDRPGPFPNAGAPLDDERTVASRESFYGEETRRSKGASGRRGTVVTEVVALGMGKRLHEMISLESSCTKARDESYEQ
jgi:hypothetical protein